MGFVASGIFAYGIPFLSDSEGYAFEWAEQFDGADGWDRMKELEHRLGVAVDFLGHVDYGLPFVHIAESHRKASWAETVRISALTVGNDWQDKLVAFAAETGLDGRQCEPPGWWLSSDYG